VPSLLLALLTPLVLAYYKHDSINPGLVYIACLGFFLSKSGNGSAIGLLRVMDHANLVALGTTVDWALRLLLSAALAGLGFLDVKFALCVSFLAPIIVNLWYILTARKLFNLQVANKGALGWSPQGFLKRMHADMRLVAAQIGLSISDLMAKDLDILILSLTMSLESIGLYRAAKYLVQILWRAVDPFYLALLPEVQRLWSAQRYVELKTMLTRISIQLFAGATLLIGAMWLGLWLFSGMFFGQGYEGLPGLAPKMSLWLLVCAPLIWGGTLAFAIGHPEITLAGSLIGSIAGVILFFTLVPLLGLTGAAIAWSSTLAIGFAFTTLVSIRVARQKISSAQMAEAAGPT
jgi:O-antigen/teichoic acid export membrane protein